MAGHVADIRVHLNQTRTRDRSFSLSKCTSFVGTRRKMKLQQIQGEREVSNIRKRRTIQV
jgi:hypothetical protein